MTWPGGAKAVRYLLGEGRLETVDRSTASSGVQGNLDRAARRLRSARAAMSEDAEGAYSLAYDAYRMAAESLLAAQGLRSTGGERGHKTVEEAVSAQFTSEDPAFAQPIFERLRQTRHSAQYFDPEGPEITPDDAEWAMQQAERALAAATKLVSSGRLEPFEA